MKATKKLVCQLILLLAIISISLQASADDETCVRLYRKDLFSEWRVVNKSSVMCSLLNLRKDVKVGGISISIKADDITFKYDGQETSLSDSPQSYNFNNYNYGVELNVKRSRRLVFFIRSTNRTELSGTASLTEEDGFDALNLFVGNNDVSYSTSFTRIIVTIYEVMLMLICTYASFSLKFSEVSAVLMSLFAFLIAVTEYWYGGGQIGYVFVIASMLLPLPILLIFEKLYIADCFGVVFGTLVCLFNVLGLGAYRYYFLALMTFIFVMGWVMASWNLGTAGSMELKKKIMSATVFYMCLCTYAMSFVYGRASSVIQRIKNPNYGKLNYFTDTEIYFYFLPLYSVFFIFMFFFATSKLRNRAIANYIRHQKHGLKSNTF